MIELYKEIEEGPIYNVPYVIRTLEGLSYWCSSPQLCIKSLKNEGINLSSSTPEKVGADLIGTYGSLEELQMELILED